MSIKILQITAAYKPAYIYGGPTMSVAKLCETLVGNCEQYRSFTVDCLSSEEKPETNTQDKLPTVHRASSVELIEINNEKSPSSIVHRPSFEDKTEIKNEQRITNNEKSQPYIVHQETNNEQRTTKDEQPITKNVSFDLEVFTTTANGKTELNVTPNEIKKVDGVKVTYFKRLTKDHTHFSPALLLALRSEILKHNRKVKAEKTSTVYRPSSGEIIETKNEKSPSSIVHRLSFEEVAETKNEKRKTLPALPAGKNDLIIHIHAWWNLVSILSCAIAKWYKIPVVLSPRGMLTAYTTTNRNSLAKQIIHYILGKSLLKYCYFHVTSEKEKRDVLTIITPKSITVIPNLVELEGEKSSGVHRQSFDEELPTNNEQRATDNELSSIVNRPWFDEELPTNNPVCLIGREQRATDNELSSSVHRPPFDEELPTNNPARLFGGEKRPFQLIFLSRIEEKKGLNLLFEALTNLPFKWNLTIAGSGEENYVESLKTKAESLKLSDKINWTGQVKNEDKFKLLAEHDLMVLNSYNENFANVVIESLSVGTAVLLSNEVGLAEYVEEKKLGWITDLIPENINHNIIKAFESVNSRTLIRANAPQLIAEDFNSKNLIQKYFILYSKINEYSV